jgi:hypothetical protein
MKFKKNQEILQQRGIYLYIFKEVILNFSNQQSLNLGPIYRNHIMFAQDLSNKIFSPPRHEV